MHAFFGGLAPLMFRDGPTDVLGELRGINAVDAVEEGGAVGVSEVEVQGLQVDPKAELSDDRVCTGHQVNCRDTASQWNDPALLLP